MGTIDIHTHAFPDALAGRAIPYLEAEAFWPGVADGTTGALLAGMDEAGVEVSVICNIATKPSQTKVIVEWCGQIRSDRLEPLASVHPEDPEGPDWIGRIADAGLAGIKLHPMYQSFAADDERMDPVYAAAAQTGLLVTFHCGRDIAYPPEDDRASPRRIRNVLDRHPGLKVVATHLGGWRDWDAVEEHLLGQDVYFETSFTLGHLAARRVADMIRRHRADRMVFGSDWPWNAQADEIARVRSLQLPEDLEERLLATNAAELLGR